MSSARSRRADELVANGAGQRRTSWRRFNESTPMAAGSGRSSHERIPFVSYPYEWTFSMLKDAALLQLDLLLAALDEDLIAEGRDALQRPVARRAAGLHRRRLLRAAARGRAVGRLPAVLHALPLPAAAPGVQGHAVPAVAAGVHRRDHADGHARHVHAPRRFRRGVLTHVFLHARLEAPLRRSRRRGPGRSSGSRVRPEPRRSERQRDDALSRADCTPAAERANGSDYRSTCTYDDRDAVAKDDFVRRVVGERKARPRLGSRLQRRALLADRGRERRLRRSPSTRTDTSSRRCTRSCEPAPSGTSCPWSSTSRIRLRQSGGGTPSGRLSFSVADLTLVLCLALVHHLSHLRERPSP